MTKNTCILAAAAAVTAAGLAAQSSGTAGGSSFQQANQMGQPTLAARPTTGGSWSVTASPSQPVVGKPFSAKEERKTVQTLADGTQIENTDSNLVFRDSQGRMRIEQTVGGKARVIISDPANHTSVILDPAAKTATKSPTIVATARSAGVGAVMRSGGGGGGAGGFGGGGGAIAGPRAGATASELYADGYAAGQAQAARDLHPESENLGVQIVNGISAEGTRVTQIIPAGRIGNNRDIHIVNERWYSVDLQGLVKTVNSDPRFGVTTYQMTNIVQAVPDAALFQIPPDYTVNEPRR